MNWIPLKIQLNKSSRNKSDWWNCMKQIDSFCKHHRKLNWTDILLPIDIDIIT